MNFNKRFWSWRAARFRGAELVSCKRVRERNKCKMHFNSKAREATRRRRQLSIEHFFQSHTVWTRARALSCDVADMLGLKNEKEKKNHKNSSNFFNLSAGFLTLGCRSSTHIHTLCALSGCESQKITEKKVSMSTENFLLTHFEGLPPAHFSTLASDSIGPRFTTHFDTYSREAAWICANSPNKITQLSIRAPKILKKTFL